MKKRGVVHEAWHLPDLRAPVDPRAMITPDRVGTYASTEECAMSDLARAIHHAESNGCAISWSAQERAAAYLNEHGLSAALTEAARLEAMALP